MSLIDAIKAISGWEEKSPAELAATLNANPRHVRNAFITGGPRDSDSVNLLHLLTARYGVLSQNNKQEWQGSLVDLAEVNQQVGVVMGLLYPHLQVENSIVYCRDSNEAATMVNAIVAAVGGIRGDVPGVTADVALLTGGRVYGSVTAEQVNEALNQIQQAEDYLVRQSAVNAISSRCVAANAAAQLAFDAGSSVETITAAAEAAWAGN